MLAGSVTGGDDPATSYVSVYVVLAEGPRSRLFKVTGPKNEPRIEELDAATTLDIKRYRELADKDVAEHGPPRPGDAAWACDVVRVHLRADLGL